jgi:anti-anti-sigma factor
MANSISSASVLVSVPGETAILKIEGRANFTSSVNFKSVISELVARGVKRFVFDLTNCLTMDSTFLGVLAGFALKLSNGNASANEQPLELVNPNARVADLLENLGVAHLFKTVHQSDPVDAGKPCLDGQTTPSREEISKTCLEAHQILMAANSNNIPKFKDVVRFLEEDLQKGQDPKSDQKNTN